MGQQVCGQLVVGDAPAAALDHGNHSLSPLLIGNADHRGVGHCIVGQQNSLDLGGVDVDAAADDHVLGPTGDEQVPVLVEVADVANGEHVPSVRGLRGLLVAVVAEACHSPVVDVAGLVRAEPVPVVVEDGELDAADRPADGSRLLQPAVGLGDGRRALHPAVGLPQHWTPPLEHGLLDLARAGGRGVDHRMQAGHVVALADLERELEHPMEQRCDHVRRAHPISLDQPQCLLGVETGHYHQRMADVQGPSVVAVRTAVVHRSGHEVRAIERPKVECPAEQGGVVHRPVGVAARSGPADALGRARRARCVGDHPAVASVGRQRCRLVGQQRFERQRVGHVAGPDHSGQMADSLAVGAVQDVGVVLMDDQGRQLRMLQDRGDLSAGQVSVDQRQIPACLLAGKGDLHQQHSVRGQHADDRISAGADRAKAVDQAVGSSRQLAVGAGAIGRVGDRHAVGPILGDVPEAQPLVPVVCRHSHLRPGKLRWSSDGEKRLVFEPSDGQIRLWNSPLRLGLCDVRRLGPAGSHNRS